MKREPKNFEEFADGLDVNADVQFVQSWEKVKIILKTTRPDLYSLFISGEVGNLLEIFAREVHKLGFLSGASLALHKVREDMEELNEEKPKD